MPGYNYAKSPDGTLLLADGLGPVKRWNGLDAALSDAGFAGPAAAVVVASTGSGVLQGTYVAYERFLDAQGLVSNFSPVSNEYETYFNAKVSDASDTTPVVITTTASHFLNTGAVVQVVGVRGNTAANGLWKITRLSATTFSLNNSTSNGTYTSGGNYVVSAWQGVCHTVVQGKTAAGADAPTTNVACAHHHFAGIGEICVVGVSTPSVSAGYVVGRFRNLDFGQSAQTTANFGAYDYLRTDDHNLVAQLSLTGTVFGQNFDNTRYTASVSSTAWGHVTSVSAGGTATMTLPAGTPLQDFPFNPSYTAGFGPRRVTLDGNTRSGNNADWLVTAVTASSLDRNFALRGTPAAAAGTGGYFSALRVVEDASNATPIVVTSTNHGLANGAQVRIGDVLGNTAANGVWTVNVVSANQFSLNGSTGNGAMTNNNLQGGGVNTNAAVWTSGAPVFAATNATPVVVRCLAHGLATGATIYLKGVVGNTAANGAWTVTRVDDNSFSLNTSVGNGLYRGGGYWFTTHGGTNWLTDVIGGATLSLIAPAHGLSAGGRVTLAGTSGFANLLDGPYTAGYIDADTLSADAAANLADAAEWLKPLAYPGFAYVTGDGVASITYASVEAPTDARVVRRQILRNTDGQLATFYVDVDTTNLVATSFSSTKTDTQLQAEDSVPLLDSDGRIFANSHGVPPGHKAVLAHHLERMFAAAEVAVTAGNAKVTNGSATVTGVGTAWTTGLEGRFLYVVGATASYEIDSVDAAAQTLTLTDTYAGTTDQFAVYAIRPAPAERRLVYYSQSGLPESWLATDAISLQEDGDEITGLMVKGSFLYILERRHNYRFTFQSDPAADGYVFLSGLRGCVNNRCWVTVEDVAYLLDEQGVHAFGGGDGAAPAGHAVQDVFRADGLPWRVNWAASDYFHAVHYSPQETIRWFVALAGHAWPRHALAYNYREKRWWVEEFAAPVGASAAAYQPGPKVYLGSHAKKVLGYWANTLDGPDPEAGTVRGTVTASGRCWLEDSLAAFATSALAGHPVVIAKGRGKGQVRVVSAVSGTRVTVTQPWLVEPDTTSVYQLGGVPWRWRSGWFRYQDSEEDAPASARVVFGPTASACTLDLRVYKDHSEDPVVWAVDQTAAQHGGLEVAAGETDIVGDMTKASGHFQQNMDRHRELRTDGPRYARLELGGVTNRDPVKVYKVALDGLESDSGS